MYFLRNWLAAWPGATTEKIERILSSPSVTGATRTDRRREVQPVYGRRGVGFAAPRSPKPTQTLVGFLLLLRQISRMRLKQYWASKFAPFLRSGSFSQRSDSLNHVQLFYRARLLLGYQVGLTVILAVPWSCRLCCGRFVTIGQAAGQDSGPSNTKSTLLNYPILILELLCSPIGTERKHAVLIGYYDYHPVTKSPKIEYYDCSQIPFYYSIIIGL